MSMNVSWTQKRKSGYLSSVHTQESREVSLKLPWDRTKQLDCWTRCVLIGMEDSVRMDSVTVLDEVEQGPVWLVNEKVPVTCGR